MRRRYWLGSKQVDKRMFKEAINNPEYTECILRKAHTMKEFIPPECNNVIKPEQLEKITKDEKGKRGR